MLNIWLNFIKSLPLYILFFTFLESIVFLDIKGLLLLFGGILSEIINMILKIIFKFIFHKYGNLKNEGYYFPFLGRGDRPPNAKECGFFNTCKNNIELSFGFPSGHSQFIMFFTFFLITYIYFKNKNWSIMLLIFIISLLAVYTRVQINCHTIQQVIYG